MVRLRIGNRRACGILVLALIALALAGQAAYAHTLRVGGNAIVFDGRRGQVLYRSKGDLDGDGRVETVLLAWTYDMRFGGIIVAHETRGVWREIATEGSNTCDARADVTDINGDGRPEVVWRGISGDGHGICSIFALRRGSLVELAHFWKTTFRDLSGDGVPEALSISPISFMFTGDHWLTIYKWNGRGYTDVSLRFPREYDAVIHDLRRTMWEFQYTRHYGPKFSPSTDPDIFADFYYYLGKAYEHRRLPQKARAAYAIAYRLDHANEDAVKAFHRTWKKAIR